VFARSLKALIAGIRSLTADRTSSPVRQELKSTPHTGDQSVSDSRQPAAYQKSARDVEVVLDRYGVAS